MVVLDKGLAANDCGPILDRGWYVWPVCAGVYLLRTRYVFSDFGGKHLALIRRHDSKCLGWHHRMALSISGQSLVLPKLQYPTMASWGPWPQKEQKP